MAYKCKECDSDKVEGKYWVNLNTFKVSDMADEGEENWCPNCEDMVEVYDDDVFT